MGRRAPERRIVTVKGEPAIASFWRGQLHSVATIETDGERIHGFYTIANPDKRRAFAFLNPAATGTEKATTAAVKPRFCGVQCVTNSRREGSLCTLMGPRATT